MPNAYGFICDECEDFFKGVPKIIVERPVGGVGAAVAKAFALPSEREKWEPKTFHSYDCLASWAIRLGAETGEWKGPEADQRNMRLGAAVLGAATIVAGLSPAAGQTGTTESTNTGPRPVDGELHREATAGESPSTGCAEADALVEETPTPEFVSAIEEARKRRARAKSRGNSGDVA